MMDAMRFSDQLQPIVLDPADLNYSAAIDAEVQYRITKAKEAFTTAIGAFALATGKQFINPQHVYRELTEEKVRAKVVSDIFTAPVRGQAR